jgi:hypothetical protein
MAWRFVQLAHDVGGVRLYSAMFHPKGDAGYVKGHRIPIIRRGDDANHGNHSDHSEHSNKCDA